MRPEALDYGVYSLIFSPDKVQSLGIVSMFHGTERYPSG